jgi:ParB family transcriptional regulator, chromosome partitioning protein
MATRKTTKSGAPSRPATRRVAPRRVAARRLTPAKAPRGLVAAEIALPLDDVGIAALVEAVRAAGGVAVGAYRDPLGSRPLLVATLPLAAVQPTPFQRDLSPTHSKRLAVKIDEARAFLDPLIVVRGHDGRFWTPNGRHRLAAAKVLGLRQVTALVSPDESLAYRILALNTEKAHNLKDRSLEVIRMARTLAKREPKATESQYADQFEAPELLTLGIVYEQNARFAGGAYAPFLKKVDRFAERTLAASLRERDGYADRLQAIDVEVKRVIAALQAKGFKSPYLRNYVVARINPVRFHVAKPGEKKPAMPIGQGLTRMTAAVKRFDPDSVSTRDLAWLAVGAGASE